MQMHEVEGDLLLTDRRVFAVAVLHMWTLGIALWQDKTLGYSQLSQPQVCLLTLFSLGCLHISLDSLLMWEEMCFQSGLK